MIRLHRKIFRRNAIDGQVLFPLTIGFHVFDEIPDSPATVAFVPGLEVSVPITSNWTLRLLGQVGYGKDLSGGRGAWIFGTGILSLAVFPWMKWEFSLGHTLMGAIRNYGESEFDNGFSVFEIGVDFD